MVRLMILHDVLIAGDNSGQVHGGGDSGVQRVVCLGQVLNYRGELAGFRPSDVLR